MDSNNGGGRGGRREGAGRPRGIMNDTGLSPKNIREAMIQGAINSKYGKDPDHPDQPNSLVNFFKNVAEENLAAFCTLFGKILPRHVHTQTESTIGVDVVYRTVDEVKRAMLDAGMTPQQIEYLEKMLPVSDVIEDPVSTTKKKDELE